MTTLTGTGPLTRLALRRDRVLIVIWLYVLVALVAASVYGFRKLYPTAAGLDEFIATAGRNPSLLAIYGPLFGHTLGTLTAWRDAVFCSLGISLMSIFIVVRHTRADEESGRLELVGSAPVGRHAALVAGLVTACVAEIGIGVLMAVVAIALGLPAAGSFALAGGIVGCGLVFIAVAALTAQAAQTARSARGLAIGVLAVMFLLRAIGDAAGAAGPRWLSWLSPIGWAELNRAFGSAGCVPERLTALMPVTCGPGIRWWLLPLALAVAAVLGTGAALLAVRRDYGAGLLPQRPGPRRGRPGLRSPFALAWRLQRATVLAWCGGALIWGAGVGSAAKGITGLLGSRQVKKIVAEMGGQANLTDAYLAAILSLSALVAAGFAVSAVLRLRSEETEERADPVLATRTGRVAWGLSHLVIAVAGTVVILAIAGLGAGLGYGLRSGGGGAEIGRLLLAGLAQAPAALVIGGIAAALFGLAPKASTAVSWSVLGVAALLLLLGPTLQLSHWLLDVSPFTHAPRLPGGTASAVPLAALVVIALALCAAGLAGLRRRDIG